MKKITFHHILALIESESHIIEFSLPLPLSKQQPLKTLRNIKIDLVTLL
jgi:hypothetical protein